MISEFATATVPIHDAPNGALDVWEDGRQGRRVQTTQYLECLPGSDQDCLGRAGPFRGVSQFLQSPKKPDLECLAFRPFLSSCQSALRPCFVGRLRNYNTEKKAGRGGGILLFFSWTHVLKASMSAAARRNNVAVRPNLLCAAAINSVSVHVSS